MVDPVFGCEVPVAQLSHEVDPVAAWYVPGIQIEQKLAPSIEYRPATQLMHALAPVFE